MLYNKFVGFRGNYAFLRLFPDAVNNSPNNERQELK